MKHLLYKGYIRMENCTSYNPVNDRCHHKSWNDVQRG